MSEFNGTGLVLRDFSAVPVGSMAYAPAFPDDLLIPEVEWAERLAELRAAKSGLLDVRRANYSVLKSFNQGKYGLCWAFSTTKAATYVRFNNNGLRKPLSPWYVAGKIKNWRDQGGYGAQSLKWFVEHGAPSLDLCPKYSREYDTEEAAEDAKGNLITEWFDGSDNWQKAQHQLISMLLVGIPGVVDLASMGHSMCCIDIQSLKPLVLVYDNSWAENMHPEGLHIGKGADTKPQGVVFPRVMTANT